MKLKILFAVGIFVAALVVFLFLSRGWIIRRLYTPTETSLPEGVQQPAPFPSVPREPQAEEGVTSASKPFQVIAEGLQIPWEIAFLPDGDLLVTQRPGTLKRIGKDKRTYSIEGVAHVGEGGLLGMALHPRFAQNQWIYLYLTTRDKGVLTNRIERYRLLGDELLEKTAILENIPGGTFHDGGRVVFGPDGFLYATTGDAGDGNLAQDKNSLAGKILRLRDDGAAAAANPFGNAVYSYGHRNSQGLAWDGEGRLWATEHGRSGAQSGLDELNRIEPGKNYGWPVIQGDARRAGMESPVIHSGADETWAPAGAAFWNGSVFFGGLRGESLYEADLRGPAVTVKAHLRGTFGRIRGVVLGPDGFLYITTSNTDGRGTVRPGDDKLIKIDPAVFRAQ